MLVHHPVKRLRKKAAPFFKTEGQGAFFSSAAPKATAFFSASFRNKNLHPTVSKTRKTKPLSHSAPYIARDTPSQMSLQEFQESRIHATISFLNVQRDQVSFERRRAQSAIFSTQGRSAKSRAAHPLLNQRLIRTYLRRGRQIYNNERRNIDANHPLLGELRVTYSLFLREVYEAFTEAHRIAQHNSTASNEENREIGESLVSWMEASPFQTSALAGRTNFTSEDVTASRIQGHDLEVVLNTILPHINLAKPGMISRARRAITNTQSRVTLNGNAAQRTHVTGNSQVAARNALTTLSGAERTINEAINSLRASIQRINTWLQNPTQVSSVGQLIHQRFNTQNPAYVTLLKDRITLMCRNLEGNGSLFAHMHRENDPTACDTASTLGQMIQPYEFVFCGQFSNLHKDANVLLHELAHAVIPGRGTKSRATHSGIPLDRAYGGERLMRRMTTEEALNNAESYSELIMVLSGKTVARVPADTVTGCSDSSPILDALAVAQSAHRRSWTMIHTDYLSLHEGNFLNPIRRKTITKHLGEVSDTVLLEMLEDFKNLHQNASTWGIPKSFTCLPARNCPSQAQALNFTHIFRNGSTSKHNRRNIHNFQICPAFFNLSSDDRIRLMHAVVSLSSGASFLKHPDRIWDYAKLALAMYREFGAPPASSLSEHQAADRTHTP